MKTPEEMAAYFKAMPSKKKENPYWKFSETGDDNENRILVSHNGCPFDDQMLVLSGSTLREIREFFRRYYESFHSEAQVLCVDIMDEDKLQEKGIPILTEGYIGPYDIAVMVLPQDNHGATSNISDWFWQTHIVDAGIVPIARIHSHHVLTPYQSITDYSTLNSGTLEMVLGQIFDDGLHVCYWLDVPGTDIKAQTFVAHEYEADEFIWGRRRFNGPDAQSVAVYSHWDEASCPDEI